MLKSPQEYRKARACVFKHLAENIERAITILDVGGTVEYWKCDALIPFNAKRIILLNLFRQNVSNPFESTIGDACDLSSYKDNSFDVVFSNSTINLLNNACDQASMASEMRRVAKKYFLQTPNHYFPIDWRTKVPFFHLLSPHAQSLFFHKINVGTYRRTRSKEKATKLATRIRNLTYSELKTLFPDASLISEQVFGFSKSFMVTNLHK